MSRRARPGSCTYSVIACRKASLIKSVPTADKGIYARIAKAHQSAATEIEGNDARNANYLGYLWCQVANTTHQSMSVCSAEALHGVLSTILTPDGRSLAKTVYYWRGRQRSCSRRVTTAAQAKQESAAAATGAGASAWGH